MNNQLPPNCPMRRSDYSHYCPSNMLGPQTYLENGRCYHHDQCVHTVREFKRMHIEHTSDIEKRFGM